MNTYTPDKWVVLRINYGSETIDKVLAGWYGGFAGSDTWQLNSGIKRVEEFDNRFEFHGYSGSVYVCYKAAHGFTSLTRSMLGSWQKRETMDIKVLEEYNVRSEC